MQRSVPWSKVGVLAGLLQVEFNKAALSLSEVIAAEQKNAAVGRLLKVWGQGPSKAFSELQCDFGNLCPTRSLFLTSIHCVEGPGVMVSERLSEVLLYLLQIRDAGLGSGPVKL
jgi:hypothetical protein